MNPVAFLIDVVANVFRFLRNVLAGLLPAPEFVILVVSGSLPERRPAPTGRLRRLIGGPLAMPQQESLQEFRERLRTLATDPQVRGVVLKVGDLRAGPASLEALRRALLEFRSAGKRLAAYLVTCDLLSYYLASVADTVVVPESAQVGLFGPRVEATFFRAAFDRLGILPEFHHIAEYKTAANRWLHAAMPEAQREVVTSVLDSQFDELVAAIARSRQVPAEVVHRAIDDGLLSADEAHERRLIDTVAFEDELPILLGTPQTKVRILPWAQARTRIPLPYRWRSWQREAIGVVELVGAIVPGESRSLPFPLPGLGMQHFAGHETVARAFRAAEKHPRVKALVFHVESPGGSAAASDMIWREVERVQRTKPVVVHMANVAGSGGYYVACGSRHIVAGAMTVTGSIGVVSGKFNFQGLYAKGGLHREVIARGETASMPSGFQSYSPGEWQVLTRWMDAIYLRFKARVAEGRRTSVQEVETIARGRVWTGRQALEHGLVDEIGDFEAAVGKARALAGIAADAPVVTIRPPKTAGVPAAAATWVPAVGAAWAMLQEPALLLMSEMVIRS